MSWRLEAALQCSSLRVPLLYGFLRIQAPVWERPILGLADRDRFFFQSFEASPLYWLLTVYIATNLGGFLSSSGGFFQQHLLFSELGRWSWCPSRLRRECKAPRAEGWEGQTLPRQSSPLDRASDGIPRAHPPLPPHPNSGGGGAAVTRAYVGEGFGSAQNEHQR